MMRGPLSNPDFKGQFSGHETFPLRLLWLRKAYDAVCKHDGHAPRSLFTDPEAIIRFGVGRNMVTSIRHWALACDIIEEAEGGYRPTKLGNYLFDDAGRDPFVEHPATIWLLHWIIAGRPDRTTTWYWAFNYFNAQTFDRDALASPIMLFCRERKRQRTSAATIRRDVECFIRSYVHQPESKFSDDMMEPLLAELGLIRPINRKTFEYRRGPKPSLPDGIFNFALLDFWKNFASEAKTLAVESIIYEPGSPGRVFKLDEFSLVERLAGIEESSKGQFLWTDTAGVRNISARTLDIDPFAFLESAYGRKQHRRAA